MPFSESAEKGVLSCFLHNPTDLLPDFKSKYSAEFFYHPANRLIYEVMMKFWEDGRPVEYIAISQHLQDKGLMDKVGGQGAVAQLLDFVPTPTHYGYYSSILRDKYLLRRQVQYHTDWRDRSYEYQEDVEKLVNDAAAASQAIQKEMMGLMHRRTWRQEVDEWEDQFGKKLNKEIASCRPTRWRQWNAHFGGLSNEYHLLKGKTSRGKTSLGINNLTFTGVILGVPSIWFPLEMPTKTLISRMIADLAEVNALLVSQPDSFPPNREQRNRIAEAKDRIADAPIEIVKQSGMDVSFITSRINRFADEHGEVGLIGIDYLQRIPHPSWRGKNDNNSDMVTYINGRLFEAQQDIGCPMLVISSTNKDGDSLGSSSPDYDADIAIEVDSDNGIKVTKWRNGPKHLDWMKLEFNKYLVRFEPTEPLPQKKDPDMP